MSWATCIAKSAPTWLFMSWANCIAKMAGTRHPRASAPTRLFMSWAHCIAKMVLGVGIRRHPCLRGCSCHGQTALPKWYWDWASAGIRAYRAVPMEPYCCHGCIRSVVLLQNGLAKILQSNLACSLEICGFKDPFRGPFLGP